MKFIYISCPRCRHSFQIDTQDKDPDLVTRLKCPDDETKPDEFGQGCGLEFDAFTYHKMKVISVVGHESLEFHKKLFNPPPVPAEKED